MSAQEVIALIEDGSIVWTGVATVLIFGLALRAEALWFPKEAPKLLEYRSRSFTLNLAHLVGSVVGLTAASIVTALPVLIVAIVVLTHGMRESSSGAGIEASPATIIGLPVLLSLPVALLIARFCYRRVDAWVALAIEAKSWLRVIAKFLDRCYLPCVRRMILFPQRYPLEVGQPISGRALLLFMCIYLSFPGVLVAFLALDVSLYTTPSFMPLDFASDVLVSGGLRPEVFLGMTALSAVIGTEVLQGLREWTRERPIWACVILTGDLICLILLSTSSKDVLSLPSRLSMNEANPILGSVLTGLAYGFLLATAFDFGQGQVTVLLRITDPIVLHQERRKMNTREWVESVHQSAGELVISTSGNGEGSFHKFLIPYSCVSVSDVAEGIVRILSERLASLTSYELSIDTHRRHLSGTLRGREGPPSGAASWSVEASIEDTPLEQRTRDEVRGFLQSIIPSRWRYRGWTRESIQLIIQEVDWPEMRTGPLNLPKAYRTTSRRRVRSYDMVSKNPEVSSGYSRLVVYIDGRAGVRSVHANWNYKIGDSSGVCVLGAVPDDNDAAGLEA